MGIHFDKKNEALGNILSFSLPNWKYNKGGVNICVHSTELCRKYCFGNSKFGNYEKPMSVYIDAIDNYEETLKESFVEEMCNELKKRDNKEVRIHATGEFYNYEYFIKWVEIDKRNPEKNFTSYNKNFEILKRFMDESNTLPKNFNIIISIFPDTYDNYSDSNILNGEKVDDLIDELVNFYNSKKYIVCYSNEFNNKLRKATKNDYFCGLKGKLSAEQENIDSNIYEYYFDENPKCDICMKCYSNEKAPARCNIYCVLRSTNGLAKNNYKKSK